MFIYCVTNDVNEKAYVGLYRGTDLRKRWARHLYEAIKIRTRMPLHAAMRKHGVHKFHITSIWSGHIPVRQLGELERYFIRVLRTKGPNGYNVTDGGSGMLGVKQTEEHVRRRVAGKAGYKHSPETLAKMRGRTVSAEHRARISGARRLRGTSYTPSEETREKIRQRHKGRIVSEETKAKMRANHFKVMSPEHRAKVIEASKKNWFKSGHGVTEKTRERLRAGALKHWEKRRSGV